MIKPSSISELQKKTMATDVGFMNTSTFVVELYLNIVMWNYTEKYFHKILIFWKVTFEYVESRKSHTFSHIM